MNLFFFSFPTSIPAHNITGWHLLVEQMHMDDLYNDLQREKNEDEVVRVLWNCKQLDWMASFNVWDECLWHEDDVVDDHDDAEMCSSVCQNIEPALLISG